MKCNKMKMIGLIVMVVVTTITACSIALWQVRRFAEQDMLCIENLQPAANNPFYKLSAQALSEDKDAAVDAAVEQVLAELDVWDASDYEKIKAVYYYVCTHVTYDSGSLYDPDSDVYNAAGTIYNALILGKAICSGYARLVERLLLELDVDCVYVSGNRSEYNIGHAWNVVELDGLYYILDATNGADATEPGDAYFLATYVDLNFKPDSWYMTDEWFAQHPMAQERYLESCCGMYSNGIAWELDEKTRILTVTGEGQIPDDLPLWDSWRQFRWAVEGINIGEGITEIGEGAFEFCASAKWINLPDSLQQIGDSSFVRCMKVQELRIPASVTKIGESAFLAAKAYRM